MEDAEVERQQDGDEDEEACPVAGGSDALDGTPRAGTVPS
jgi:hypothetical protein